MKKRITALFMAIAVACTSTTAYAHDSDVFGGKYVGLTNANFFVRIHSSAENEIFTFYDVYLYGEEWNGISSNVDLYVMRVGESVSTALNQINVTGVAPYSTKSSNFYGRTVAYDKDGKVIGDEDDEKDNDDWLYSRIEINTSEKNHYYMKPDHTVAARKVFLHELGHALKLAHPVQSTTHSGNNTYNGYPYAIMNYGDLDGKVCASNTITDHDKSCLIAKWGK